MREQDARGELELAEEKAREDGEKSAVFKLYQKGKSILEISELPDQAIEEVQLIIDEYEEKAEEEPDDSFS